MTSVVLSVIVVLLFIMTLAVTYVRFTVYEPAHFAKSVSKRVNDAYIKSEIAENITMISNHYGFDHEVITPLLDEIDFKEVSGKYFGDFYNAFLNGEKLPVSDFGTEVFLTAIENNYSTALYPDLYEMEENRTLLAEKYADAVNISISTLSIDSVNSALAGIKAPFRKFTDIGRYFTPLIIAFIVCFELLLFLLIHNKRTGSLYTLLLTLFTVSMLFTVPFAYLSSQNLVARFNINLGAGYAYIEAIWNLMITSPAVIFTVISSVLLVSLLAVIVTTVFKNSKANSKRFKNSI